MMSHCVNTVQMREFTVRKWERKRANAIAIYNYLLTLLIQIQRKLGYGKLFHSGVITGYV